MCVVRTEVEGERACGQERTIQSGRERPCWKEDNVSTACVREVLSALTPGRVGSGLWLRRLRHSEPL